MCVADRNTPGTACVYGCVPLHVDYVSMQKFILWVMLVCRNLDVAYVKVCRANVRYVSEADC